MTTKLGAQGYGDVAPSYPLHPGTLLAEELEARGMTRRELVLQTGRSSRTVSEIINGKRAITAETALDLEKALGVSAQSWMNLQSSYDLILARRRRDKKSA